MRNFTINNIFPKIVSLWDKVEKYGTAGQAIYAIQYNTEHALCTLDNQAYTHTLRTCNANRLSPATVNVKAPQCYLVCTLPVSLSYCVVSTIL
jgi:hypothetical protein